jgi:Tfp pilus assembly protein PilF
MLILFLYDDRSIQAARQKLDRQRASDSLKKNLEHRPDREELVERMFSLLYSASSSLSLPASVFCYGQP